MDKQDKFTLLMLGGACFGLFVISQLKGDNLWESCLLPIVVFAASAIVAVMITR